MKKYEILYIVRTGLNETLTTNSETGEAVHVDKYQETADKYAVVVTEAGGEVESVEKWGPKRLAYMIDHKSEGYYIVMKFSGSPAIPAELERLMRLSDDIIRFVVTLRK